MGKMGAMGKMPLGMAGNPAAGAAGGNALSRLLGGMR
jgi:hypothetical protein